MNISFVFSPISHFYFRLVCLAWVLFKRPSLTMTANTNEYQLPTYFEQFAHLTEVRSHLIAGVSSTFIFLYIREKDDPHCYRINRRRHTASLAASLMVLSKQSSCRRGSLSLSLLLAVVVHDCARGHTKPLWNGIGRKQLEGVHCDDLDHCQVVDGMVSHESEFTFDST